MSDVDVAAVLSENAELRHWLTESAEAVLDFQRKLEECRRENAQLQDKLDAALESLGTNARSHL